jgi:hypothetical protein
MFSILKLVACAKKYDYNLYQNLDPHSRYHTSKVVNYAPREHL